MASNESRCFACWRVCFLSFIVHREPVQLKSASPPPPKGLKTQGHKKSTQPRKQEQKKSKESCRRRSTACRVLICRLLVTW